MSGEVSKPQGGSVTRRGGHPVRWALTGFAFIGVVTFDAKYLHLVHDMFGSVSWLVALAIVFLGLGMITWGAVTRR